MRLHGSPVEARVVLPLRHPSERIRDLVCYEDDGVLLYEGDIIVERASPILNLAPHITIGRLGHILSDSGKTWPSGIIPVDVPSDMKSTVDAAIEIWESSTPLRFPRVSHETDYISFVWSSRNGSSVGRKTGTQVLELEEEASLRTVIHEIGHAVGLYHEHSRPDKDQYIEVHEGNLKVGAIVNFTQPSTSAVHGPYDYSSVMHYDAFAFTANEQPTITTRNGASIGHLSELSAGDVQACRTLYSDLSWI